MTAPKQLPRQRNSRTRSGLRPANGVAGAVPNRVVGGQPKTGFRIADGVRPIVVNPLCCTTNELLAGVGASPGRPCSSTRFDEPRCRWPGGSGCIGMPSSSAVETNRAREIAQVTKKQSDCHETGRTSIGLSAAFSSTWPTQDWYGNRSASRSSIGMGIISGDSTLPGREHVNRNDKSASFVTSDPSEGKTGFWGLLASDGARRKENHRGTEAEVVPLLRDFCASVV